MTSVSDIDTLRSLVAAMRDAGVSDLRFRRGETRLRLKLAIAGDSRAVTPSRAVAVDAPSFGRLRLTRPGFPLPESGATVARGALLAFLDAGPLRLGVHAPRAGRLGGPSHIDGALVDQGAPLFEIRPDGGLPRNEGDGS